MLSVKVHLHFSKSNKPSQGDIQKRGVSENVTLAHKSFEYNRSVNVLNVIDKLR